MTSSTATPGETLISSFTVSKIDAFQLSRNLTVTLGWSIGEVISPTPVTLQLWVSCSPGASTSAT